MKRLAALLMLTAVSALAAAPWDGTKGPFSLFTFTQVGYLPGVPGMNNPNAPSLTIIWLGCSDPTITAARAAVSYTDQSGNPQQAVLLSSFTNGNGILVTTISQYQITDIKLTALHDGQTY